MTGGETIDLLGKLRGGLDEARREELVDRFELDPTKRGRQYSKGNRQKVALIAALSSDVELLILDEPTSGLAVMASIALGAVSWLITIACGGGVNSLFLSATFTASGLMFAGVAGITAQIGSDADRQQHRRRGRGGLVLACAERDREPRLVRPDRGWSGRGDPDRGSVRRLPPPRHHLIRIKGELDE
jgi:hypothetical protein